MLNIQSLISRNESESLDFKREFHENNAKLLHDILCLSNSFYEGDRFIVFSVANDKTVHDVENDLIRKQTPIFTISLDKYTSINSADGTYISSSLWA
jgi:hypothetical protein